MTIGEHIRLQYGSIVSTFIQNGDNMGIIETVIKYIVGLLIIPPIMAVSSFVCLFGLSEDGRGLPAPVGSTLFFFAPFILMFWYSGKIGKNKGTRTILRILGYLAACIIYSIAIYTEISCFPRLM